MNKKAMIAALCAVGGIAAVGLGVYAVWNSRQLRTARTAKRVGKVLNKAGAILQSVSDLTV